MLLDGDRAPARERNAGLDAQGHGERQHGEKVRELFRRGDARVLQIEALGFQVGEKRFDGPPLTVAARA